MNMKAVALVAAIAGCLLFVCAGSVESSRVRLSTDDPSAFCQEASGALVACQIETVEYDALDSPGPNLDRPSIAVRHDGLVRIAITDFQGACCPQVAPLKIATRGGRGGWTYLKINDYGDHPVPHFLPNGDLGVLYMDYADRFTIKFARVGDSSAQVENVFQLGLNPSEFTRLVPWVIENYHYLQAVVLFDLRLRRTLTDWNSVALLKTPQDIIIGPHNRVQILTSEGLLTFSGLDLNESAILNPIPGGVPPSSGNFSGNLVVDHHGQTHVAYASNGTAIYGRLLNGSWHLETAATRLNSLLNDQSLLVDRRGRPYLIYENIVGHIIVVKKTGAGWREVADLGPGRYGNMVFGPLEDIHAAFTSTSDRLVRYARLTPR